MTCLTPWEDRVRAALPGYKSLESIIRFGASPTINVAERDEVVAYIVDQLHGHWKASTGKHGPEGAPNFSYLTTALNVHTRGREALGLMAYLAHLGGNPWKAQDPEVHASWITACQASRLTGKRNPHDLAPNGREAASIRRGFYRFCVHKVGPELAYTQATWPDHDETHVQPVRLAKWNHILAVLGRAENDRSRCLFVLSISGMQDHELWNLRPDQFYEVGEELWILLDPTTQFKEGRRHPVMVGAAIVKEYLQALPKDATLLFDDPSNPGHADPALPGILNDLGKGIGPVGRMRLRNTFIATLLNVDEKVDAWLLHLMGTTSQSHLNRIRLQLRRDAALRAELLLPVQYGPTFDTHYCPAGHANRAGDVACKTCHRLLQLDALTPAGMAKTTLIKLVLQLYDRGLKPDDLAQLALQEI